VRSSCYGISLRDIRSCRVHTWPSVFITGTKLAPPHGTTGTGRNSAATSAITSLRKQLYISCARTHARAQARTHVRTHACTYARMHVQTAAISPYVHASMTHCCSYRSTHHCQTALHCCALTTTPQVDVTCLTNFSRQADVADDSQLWGQTFQHRMCLISACVRYCMLQGYTKS